MKNNMKHIRKFEQLNEVFGKRSKYMDYNEDKLDADLKKIYAAVSSVMETSPITFDVELSNDGFVFKGPFGISMRIELSKAKDDKSPQHNPQYNKVGIRAYIDKTVIEAPDPDSLWRKLEKSMEYKKFIKGEKIENMRQARLKNIIKDGKDKPEDVQDRLMLDYLYYVEPEIVTNKSDNSGPYATTGSSIRTYKYDIDPAVKAWGFSVTKPEFKTKGAKEIYDGMTKPDKSGKFKQGEGYWQGKLTPDVKQDLENTALVDVDDLGDGIYDVYTHTPGSSWNVRLDDMKDKVAERLGHKSRYLVDEKIAQYYVETAPGGKLGLVIKVQTTVWYN